MSFSDIMKGFAQGVFGPNGQVPPQVPPQAPAPQATSVTANPSVPGDHTPTSDGKGPGAFPAAAEGEKSPLEGYKELWQKADTDAKPVSTTTTMNVDPQKLLEAAKAVDFSKMIPAELREKIAKGDMEALAQAMNAVGQGAYAQSTAATAKIVEAALNKQADTFMNQVLPDVLKKAQISQGLASENPLFTNPAVAPMLDMVKTQLTTKFPTASPAEIQQKAQDFLMGFAQEVAGTNGKQITDIPKQPASSRGETDWGKFFEA